MNYQEFFKKNNIAVNPKYPRDDIGIASLFFDANHEEISYVEESGAWYFYNGKQWRKDGNGLRTMELCKLFVRALEGYAAAELGEDENALKYYKKLIDRRKRENILRDARSISPKVLSAFDRDGLLLNCRNGTFNLNTFAFQPHAPVDYMTKIAKVKYDPDARCPRWEQFIDEVMRGDAEVIRYTQKAFGYALTGDTSEECLFILHGLFTRNGKSTLCETIVNLMGDYARTVQPQTLARRSSDGAAPSPDIARLKGARLVIVPEPQKGLEWDVALVKQLTGGDTYTGRFLNENPFEFRPVCKFFLNANHLPRTSDDTIFASGRIKIIPFDRHFKPEERDKTLKELFRKPDNMSGILNWMIEGWQMMKEEGLLAPPRVEDAIKAYRLETDVVGAFLKDYTVQKEGSRVYTGKLYELYRPWALAKGYQQMNNKLFFAELKNRYEVVRYAAGNVISGLALAADIEQEGNGNGN